MTFTNNEKERFVMEYEDSMGNITRVEKVFSSNGTVQDLIYQIYYCMKAFGFMEESIEKYINIDA